MRDPHCIQCGKFIKPGKGWKRKTTKRLGGYIHDTCMDLYYKHKVISRVIRKSLWVKHFRRINPDKVKKYDHEYYIKNKQRIINRNYIYYNTNAARLRRYQRTKYTIKHYHPETDNEYLIRVWPRWKTQRGWVI